MDERLNLRELLQKEKILISFKNFLCFFEALLAMIHNLAVQSSTRTLFTMQFVYGLLNA